MPDRTTSAAAEINRINLFYGLMPRLGTRWARTRPWEGKTIAINAHLTTLTATLLRELALGGGRVLLALRLPLGLAAQLLLQLLDSVLNKP